MVVGPVLALLATVGVVAIFLWVVQLLIRLVHVARRYERNRATRLAAGRTALDILDERFASGEIDMVEFQEMRRLLLDDRQAENIPVAPNGDGSNAAEPHNQSWFHHSWFTRDWRGPLARRQH